MARGGSHKAVRQPKWYENPANLSPSSVLTSLGRSLSGTATSRSREFCGFCHVETVSSDFESDDTSSRTLFDFCVKCLRPNLFIDIEQQDDNDAEIKNSLICAKCLQQGEKLMHLHTQFRQALTSFNVARVGLFRQVLSAFMGRVPPGREIPDGFLEEVVKYWCERVGIVNEDTKGGGESSSSNKNPEVDEDQVEIKFEIADEDDEEGLEEDFGLMDDEPVEEEQQSLENTYKEDANIVVKPQPHNDEQMKTCFVKLDRVRIPARVETKRKSKTIKRNKKASSTGIKNTPNPNIDGDDAGEIVTPRPKRSIVVAKEKQKSLVKVKIPSDSDDNALEEDGDDDDQGSSFKADSTDEESDHEYEPLHKIDCKTISELAGVDCDNKIGRKKLLKSGKRRRLPHKKAKCPVCQKWISGRDHLQVHLRIHTGERPFHCSTCSASFSSRSRLTLHIRCRHDATPHSKCHICGAGFSERQRLRLHWAGIHQYFEPSETILPCTSCDKKFITQSKLRQHMAAVHQHFHPSQKILSCNFCDKKFIIPNKLKDHVERAHNPSNPAKQRNRIHKCQPCGLEFKYGALQIHKTTIEHKKKAREARTKREREERKKSENVKVKVFTCKGPDCGQIFPDLSSMQKHHRRAHPEKNYICETCGKAFYGLGALRNHRSMHTDPQLSCDQCDQKFKYIATLKKHKATLHAGKFLFPCEIPNCKEGFGARIYLRKHLVKSHPDVALKDTPFVCKPFCWLTFPTQEALCEHLKRHGATVKCEKCDFWFKNATHLQNHCKLLHTNDGFGPKPWKCEQCDDRVFNNLTNFKQHLYRHSGEWFYNCSDCTAGFFLKKELAAHKESGCQGKWGESEGQKRNQEGKEDCFKSLHLVPVGI